MLAISASLGIYHLSHSNQNLNNIIDGSAAKVRLSASIKGEFLQMHRAEKNMILLDTVEQMNAQVAQADPFESRLHENLQKLDNLADETGKKTVKEFEDAFRQFSETHKKVMQLALLNSNARAQNISNSEERPVLEAAASILDELETAFAKRAKETPEAAQAVVTAAHAGQNLLTISRIEKDMIIETEMSVMEGLGKQIEEQRTQWVARLAELDTIASPQEQAKLGELRVAWSKVLGVQARLFQVTMENGNCEATKLSCGKGRELANKCDAVLTAIIDQSNKEMEESKLDASKQFSTARGLLIALLIAGLLIGGVTSFWLISYRLLTQRSKPPAPVSMARGSPWWRPKSVSWLNAAKLLQPRSASSLRPAWRLPKELAKCLSSWYRTFARPPNWCRKSARRAANKTPAPPRSTKPFSNSTK